LNGGGSIDLDAPCGDSISSYEWDLNNDTVIDVTGATPTLTAAQLSALGLGVGPHTITLKVTDTHSLTHTASSTLTILANGAACSDGNGCTQTDTCQSGTCVGANPVTCTAIDACHVAGVCNPGTGACSNPNAPNGTPCTDGNGCTQTDTCQVGVCVGSNPLGCNDNDPCTTDSCNPGTGACVHPNAPDGTSCSDQNVCTQSDSCQSGACTGNPVVCTPSDACHVAGVCNPETGSCSNPNAADGVSCNDQNPTTCGDVCTSGACAGSPVPAPAAIDNSLTLGKSPTESILNWTDAPGPYGVYRGSNGPVPNPWSYDQTCLQSNVAGTSTSDADNPAPGEFFYYLISRFDQCRESALGMDSNLVTIPNLQPCPAP
jgi:hypothetical protein